MTIPHPWRNFACSAAVVLAACMCFGACEGDGFCRDERTQAADEAAKLIERAALAESKEALKHLTRAAALLAVEDVSAEDRERHTVRFAKVLRDKAAGPEDVLAALGPKAIRQVARQVFYRRYLEHWLYEAPLGLWVTLDCQRGEEPVLRSIRPMPR